jgi:MoaA/NifB/PqqE/SkfB family radical SAM enzyme
MQLSSLLHRLIPPALYGGATAHTLLAELQAQLASCAGAAEALAILDSGKERLYSQLQARFDDVVAKAVTLKVLNILLARFHFGRRNTTLRSRPFGLVVDPSNMCQLACPGCVHSARNEALQIFDWPKGTLTEQRYADLLRLYGPHAIAVYFCDYGEPLLNMNTPQLIRDAKRYLLSAALSTSLSVKRFDPEAYVRSGLDFMVLSVDGATQSVYQQFRRNGDLALVLSNISKLVEARRRLRSSTPVLSWNFLAFEHNAHEIPAARLTARKLGVNQFRVVNPFDVTWDDPEIRAAAIEGSVQRFDWTSTTNMPENWNPFPEELELDAIESAFRAPWTAAPADEASTTGHTCHWLYKNMIMDATGRIMPCCGAPGANGKLVFSQLDGLTADPFNSPRYREARSMFAGKATGSDPVQCAECDWDQTVVNIGGPEIRRYFRAADPAYFDAGSLKLLSDW